MRYKQLSHNIISTSKKKDHHIIAIGASAGGMEEIHSFFDHTPLDQVSYVIIQHLSPDFKSRMSELLEKHSKLKICDAEEGMTVKENQVYMISNKDYMTIENGKLIMTRKEGRKGPHMTINTFFNSLAADKGNKAIGIILSGTGTDGGIGIEAINKAGGLILVQDPTTAKYDGMPSHAISTGFFDAILRTESMPKYIEEYVQKQLEKPAPDTKHKEISLQDVLDLIKEQLPNDFSDYKHPTIQRRIKRRMAYGNFNSLNQYITFLKSNSEEMESLAKDFMISVTKFFRDKEAFDLLEKDIIPQIINGHSPDSFLKIWVAGCATGEEAYSLAILVKEYLLKTNNPLEVKIFATDIDKAALEHTSKGFYPKSITKDISEERLDRFFTPEGDGFKIKKDLRNMLIIAEHDLVKNPPYCNIDLITCRNLLIYMSPILQKKVLSMFHFGLKKEGYLFLGSSENASLREPGFLEVNKKWKIYSKIETSRTMLFNNFSFPVPSEIKSATPSYTVPISSPQKRAILVESVNEAVMDACGFAGVCIDKNMNIVQSFGDLSKYLIQKMLELNLYELLPEQLSIAARTAISQAKNPDKKVVINNIQIENKNSSYLVNLQVNPIKDSKNKEKLLLVLFNEGKGKQVVEKDQGFYKPDQHTKAYLATLEEELKETKEALQSAIDTLESNNENMESFNEELLSANEEMQSGNEELESVNEELQTINHEHQSAIKELTVLNDDLNNYFRSNVNGQLYVDNDLLLKKYSPGAVKHINLRESDIGRPLTNITTNIKFETLAEDIKMVVANGDTITKEVQSSSGKWYQVMAMPYIRETHSKQDDAITAIQEGVMISFNDVTALKRTQEELDESNKTLMRINADLDNFVYSASHDLMAPIANIEGLINVLKKKMGTNDVQIAQITEMIDKSIEKFKAVIKDLGAIGKVESEMHRNQDTINFEDIFEDVRISMLDKVMATNTKLTYDFRIKEIKFSKKNLRSIVYNLVSNAIKYSSPDRDPEITATTERQPGFIILSLSDNGMGIKADKTKSVFSLYSRLGQQVEGQGIGLYLVKKIIDATGGKVEVHSEFGKGTVFKIFFKA